MNNITKEYYEPLLEENGFILMPENEHYCELGTVWKLSPTLGKGTYWVYEQENLYDIKIHDFAFHEDTIIELDSPECLSVTYYESISGEELMPYRRLKANCVKSFIGGYKTFKANMHKKIPIKSIGIEILPAYYEEYLKDHYPGEYQSPFEAFRDIDETEDFPEMVRLLIQIKNYRGEGISAKLFYDAKVAEAVSLIVERQERQKQKEKKPLSPKDKELLETVTAYINDHYAFDIKQDQLARIACMGTTKLKETFKLMHGATITEYIQHRRISQAEHLLGGTQLTIQQVAETVGYKSASRFSELFRKTTGILPNAYRKIMQDNG